MDGPVRGRFASLSDDDDESSLRASLSSRSDEDEFPRHLPQEDEIRKFPPRISTEDDGFRKGSETGTPRSGSFSPLVQSFAALSTQSAFSFSPKACSLGLSRATIAGDLPFSSHILPPASIEPTTPSRPTKTPLCESQDFIFTSRLTPSSQVRTIYRPESKSSRIFAETPARKSTPKHTRNPLCPISSHPSSPPSFSSSSKRTPVKGKANNESRLKVPLKNESPIWFDFRKASPNATLPVSADSPLPQGASTLNSVSDEFTLKPSRVMSPPARFSNRRFSLGGELLPSPARSWPEAHDRKDAGSAYDRTSPVVCEPRHIGALTPNEPKNMVAPSRPRKKGSGTSVANRCLLNSPMAGAPPRAPSIDDVPDLPTEACPMVISNSSDTRGSKVVRRHSVVTSASVPVRAPEASPTNVRVNSSPVIVRRSSLVHGPSGAAAASLRQSPEDERNELVRCRNLTGVMVRHGMKLLCLDWDLTVVACHTKSKWYGSAEQLERWIRPVFRNLISAALQTNMRIAFVSFSGQADFINEALRIAFGARAEQFVVRCSDKKWGLKDDVFSRMFPRAKQNDASKLSHICSAATFFNNGDKENSNPQTSNIQPHNIVLIDDDQDNVVDAGKHDVHSVHMDTNNPSKFLKRLEELCGIALTSPLSLHMTD